MGLCLLEIWKVLKFLSGPVFQAKAVVGQEGIIPVRKSLIGSFIDTVRQIRPSLEVLSLMGEPPTCRQMLPCVGVHC